MDHANSLSDSTLSGSSRTTALFYNVVKSLREFDQCEVDGVVTTLLSKTDREQCFVATYQRSVSNVETLLTFGDVRHFQGVAMLARGLFELAVDMKLLEVIPCSAERMILFTDVEKLRCARKIVRFKERNPNAALDSSQYARFISSERARIDLAQRKLWPNLKRVEHWTGRSLAQRVALLNSPFDEFYEAYYPLLSWYVHAGLTGVINLRAEAIITMCGIAFRLAAESYCLTLHSVIREFGITKGNDKILQKLRAAKLLPFADNPEQAEQVFRDLVG